jgi:UPF0755 protein
MKLLKIAVVALVLAVAAGVGLVMALADNFEAKPPAPVLVDIPRGLGTRGIADLLAKNGVVSSPWHFLAARVLRSSAKLQAGQYDFTDSATAAQVLDRIARGDVHFEEITIPEGKNIWDVSELAGKLGWFAAEDFLKLTRDPEFIAQLIPEVKPAPPSLEGYLFPSTYKIVPKATPRQIITQMVGEFHRVWNSLDAKLPVQEAVILASLVETEARRPDERPTVASVYRNRIDGGMLLGCDPTVVYAALLEDRYRGKIYKSDLERESPYNTYKVRGMPPGPIANPGEASLRAALHPAQTKFLYFVAKADGSGGHNFTTNAADHNHAVAQYRHAVAAGK